MLSEIPYGRFRFWVSVPLYLEYQARLMATVAMREETRDFFRKATSRFDPKAFADALAAVPDAPPAEDDTLQVFAFTLVAAPYGTMLKFALLLSLPIRAEDVLIPVPKNIDGPARNNAEIGHFIHSP